jgi:hypothetical protein
MTRKLSVHVPNIFDTRLVESMDVETTDMESQLYT